MQINLKEKKPLEILYTQRNGAIQRETEEKKLLNQEIEMND